MSEISDEAGSLPKAEYHPISPVFVGSKQEFVEKQKVKCNVNGRDIVVFYHNQHFYAMDQHCYRKYSNVCEIVTITSSTGPILGVIAQQSTTKHKFTSSSWMTS